MRKRHIKLEVVTTNVATVFFKVKNTARGTAFNNGKDYFTASNKIAIISAMFPSWDEKLVDVLCVLGKEPKLDNMILTASHEDFERIKQAVDEYNKKFSVHDSMCKM